MSVHSPRADSGHSAQHKLQFHHIFPKAVLKGRYTDREVNDIANLSFIAGKTNRQISNKAPSVYFPAMIEKSGQAPFEAQCIPTAPELLELETYQGFLKKRRELVVARLNAFLGTDGT